MPHITMTLSLTNLIQTKYLTPNKRIGLIPSFCSFGNYWVMPQFTRYRKIYRRWSCRQVWESWSLLHYWWIAIQLHVWQSTTTLFQSVNAIVQLPPYLRILVSNLIWRRRTTSSWQRFQGERPVRACHFPPLQNGIREYRFETPYSLNSCSTL